ncbi:MAG TPA: sugar ABC transporter permease [Anaerolineales bacterium]|nr:sugar ABC transporter permease [Anaerolineales bacterium]
MSRGFDFNRSKFILAVILTALGIAGMVWLQSNKLVIGGKNLTSIGILVAGIVSYSGVLIVVSMFRNETYLAVALLLPSIVAVAIFVYGFIGWSMRVSLSSWTGLKADYTFVGLKQYTDLLFHDQRFSWDIQNTAIFTVGFILGCLLIGLGLAILLDQRLRGEALFRGIFLFPMSISFIASGVVWAWLMNPATGSRITGINLIFQDLHLGFLISLWHSSPRPIGMLFTVIPAVWQMAGFTMALYLGGIRSISEEIREAARVDGASEFEIYRYIILPMLQPVTLSAVIILGHMSLKIFDLIVALGHKDLRIDVPGIYMWTTTFDGTRYAQGAAIGILMLISVAVLVIPYLVQSMRTETQL